MALELEVCTKGTIPAIVSRQSGQASDYLSY